MKISTKNRNSIHSRKNVIGVGIGTKHCNGVDTGEKCITVFVKEKLSVDLLEKDDLIPKMMGRTKTDVIGCGDVVPLIDSDTSTHRLKHRPVVGGISCAPTGMGLSGTIGIPLVYQNGIPVMISNTHVIAPYWEDKRLHEDEIEKYGVKVGLSIHQPSPVDGREQVDEIATLLDWKKFNLEGDNFVDAAIARLTVETANEILGLGKYSELQKSEMGMKICKSGRTTGITCGVITTTDLSIDIPYPVGTVRMVNQLGITPGILSPGDSGSAIVTDSQDKKLVGLGFAGSPVLAIASPMEKVFQRFGLTMDEKSNLCKVIHMKIGSVWIHTTTEVWKRWIAMWSR